MIHHLVLFQLKPEVDDAKIEWMMRETRIQLLKISGVLNLRCGKRVSDTMEWPFFLAFDIESLEKLSVYMTDPLHVRYVEEVIKPHITNRLGLDYEIEPGKDVRYS